MISLNEIMTPDPVTLTPDVPLKNAGELMRERRIRHIPVTRDGRLEGLITQRDLLAAASAEDDYSTVADVMRTNVYTVSEDDDMRGAALKMQMYKIGCLPVVADGLLVGIVTDSDYVALAINLLEQLEVYEEAPDDFDDEDELSGYGEEEETF